MKGETLNKTSVSEHTPGPWHVSEMEGKTVSIITQDAIDNWDDAIPDICQFTKGCNANAEANAKRIVQAVNSYDDMLEALKEAQNALHYLTNQPSKETPLYEKTFKKIKAAIAKATNNQ